LNENQIINLLKQFVVEQKEPLELILVGAYDLDKESIKDTALFNFKKIYQVFRYLLKEKLEKGNSN